MARKRISCALAGFDLFISEDEDDFVLIGSPDIMNEDLPRVDDIIG